VKNFPKYGSIENLHRNGQVLEYAVVVTEKIHGSNMRVAYFPEHGGLTVGSRNNTIYRDGTKSSQDGYNMSDWTIKNVDLEKLKQYSDYVFYGEFHGSNIQKGVKYCNNKDFRVFDIRNPDGDYIDWDDVVHICNEVGLKRVPVLLRGKVEILDLEKFLNIDSEVAIENEIDIENNIAEGVVIKPLKMKRDRRGNWLRAKYKSEKWAENVSAPKVRKVDPDKAITQAAAREFASCCVTDGRVKTVIDHITRDGNTELGMNRTSEFLHAFIHDIMDEHKEVYEKLDKDQIKIYNKVVGGQAVLLWKKCVLENL
jgi:Rnl2 family RNA ligase